MSRDLEFVFGYTNIIVNGVIILITILNCVVYKLRQHEEAEFVEENKLLLSLSIRGLCYRFSLDQIHRATSNFHDELVIGRGGFGKVYQGSFENGPTVVAIKRLHSTSRQGSREFRTEIQMLSKLRHSHLVSLIGYCDDGYEMILVYEFMPGGTLADHLYKRVRKGDKSVPPLSWVQRLKICIGAARGLHYLHTGTGVKHKIIHRDVKTSNILLDEYLEAKISDFGLSKTSPANQATTFVSTRVKGTFGYLDPYYYQTNRLTWRSDVYSFGVVLFEVLCGRPAVDSTVDEEQIGLAGWAQHCFGEDILGQIIDPRIKEEACPDSVEALVEVAIQCIDTRPKHRPTMAEVVVVLESSLALQEKSTEYHLPEIIPSDDGQEEIDISELEVENEIFENGMFGISSGKHHEKKPSALKRFVAFLTPKARAIEDKELRGAIELQTGYFSLRHIKAATNNFDPANKIGEGGFGPVYKGVLSDNAVIAVKQLSSKSKQGNREFINEMGMISSLQHPNLVKLFGCCVEGNQLLLIYEYMENNSLARALFRHEEQQLNLDWPTRKKIFLHIARGLAYLHEESRLKIVHRDIKATNVLLDKDLNAKISDFGLAKLDEEENTHISTRIAGTFGYMAPEYAMRGYLTDKADVYSFGIVALEIVSGKSNTNYRPKQESVYLLDSALELKGQGNLLDLVDPILGSNYSKKEALRMLNMALLCTNPSPALRPLMSTIVSMIEGKTKVEAPIVRRTPQPWMK